MLFLFRLYRSTVCIDAAHCYRPSSMVGLSVKVISPAKMAEPVKMLFGFWTQVGLRNHVLDKGPDPSGQMGNFWGQDMTADLSSIAVSNALLHCWHCGGIIARGGRVHTMP